MVSHHDRMIGALLSALQVPPIPRTPRSSSPYSSFFYLLLGRRFDLLSSDDDYDVDPYGPPVVIPVAPAPNPSQSGHSAPAHHAAPAHSHSQTHHAAPAHSHSQAHHAAPAHSHSQARNAAPAQSHSQARPASQHYQAPPAQATAPVYAPPPSMGGAFDDAPPQPQQQQPQQPQPLQPVFIPPTVASHPSRSCEPVAPSQSERHAPPPQSDGLSESSSSREGLGVDTDDESADDVSSGWEVASDDSPVPPAESAHPSDGLSEQEESSSPSDYSDSDSYEKADD